MTERMISLIQDRISEMLETKNVQEKLIEWHNSGLTNEQCAEKITKIAIATLYGK